VISLFEGKLERIRADALKPVLNAHVETLCRETDLPGQAPARMVPNFPTVPPSYGDTPVGLPMVPMCLTFPAFLGSLRWQAFGVSLVRSAVPQDAKGMGEAIAEAWKVGYAGLFPPAQLGKAVQRRRDMWFGLINSPPLGGTLLVVEDGGTVVGFIHFGPATENGQLGEVYGLYVHPSSWGTGGAQALMGEAVESLSGSFNRAVLWTHSGADRARRFYAKSEWTTTGNERSETLWDGLVYPAVEYERVLKS
jgi:GNAT superfamily N-acetyltransferase